METALQEYNKALSDFRKSLKPDQATAFVDPLTGANNAAEAIAAGSDLESRLGRILDQRHFAKAHPALKKRIEDLQRYAPAIEVFISSNPAIAALVWGSVKIVLQSVVQFLHSFEKIFDTFQDVASTLPRVEIYQKHAKTYPSIGIALEKFHINLARFFTTSLIHLRRHGLRALVASLSGTSDAELEKIGANLKEDAHQLDRLVSAIAFDAAAEERTHLSHRAFFQWLNAEQENDQRLNLARSQIHPTTCSWITDTEEYRTWARALEPDFPAQDEDDPCPVLEIQGREGCGKTTLAAWLTDNLDGNTKNRRAVFVHYLYQSDGRVSSDNRPTLAAFVAQILRKNKSLLDADLVNLLEASYNTVASENECYNILHTLIQHFDLVIVLIDSRYAIYGSKSYTILCRLMGKHKLAQLDSNYIARKNGARPGILLKGIFLSETDDWPGWYRSKGTRVLEMSDHNQAYDEEIFVSSQAENVCNLHYEKQKPEWKLLNQKIVEQLSREPRAPFLLLGLMTEYLKLQTNPQAVEEALYNISPNVRAIYEQAFLRIQKFQDSRTQLGFHVLQWAAFALRSLHVSELAEALIVRTSDSSLDPKRRHSRLEAHIREICGPFVSVLDGFIHPSHVSMKYFLKDVRVEESDLVTENLYLTYVANYDETRRGYNPTGFETVSRNHIARACVAYLSLDSFAQLTTTKRADCAAQFPFLDYALHCWLHHVLLLASYLKNPQKGYRLELGFEREILELVSRFVALPQSWTYLQSLVVFSSVREALETLQSHMWPVRELEQLMRGPHRKGQESDEANALESWMEKAIAKLKMVQDMPVTEALPKLRDE